MTSIDPPWRVKSRPCPFHATGSCLFGTACNFIHDAQSNPQDDPYIRRATHATVTAVPALPSSGLKRSNSVRSPPRSPRLANLLFALKEIIGEDQDGGDDAEAERASVITEKAEFTAPRPSVTPPPHTIPHSSDHPTADDGLPDVQDGLLSQIGLLETHPPSLNESLESTPESRLSDLLSPSDASLFPNVPFLQDPEILPFDSGFTETWISPSRLRTSPPPHSPPTPSTINLFPSPPASPMLKALSSPPRGLIARVSTDACVGLRSGFIASPYNCESSSSYSPSTFSSAYDPDEEHAGERTTKPLKKTPLLAEDHIPVAAASSPVHTQIDGPTDDTWAAMGLFDSESTSASYVHSEISDNESRPYLQDKEQDELSPLSTYDPHANNSPTALPCPSRPFISTPSSFDSSRQDSLNDLYDSYSTFSSPPSRDAPSPRPLTSTSSSALHSNASPRITLHIKSSSAAPSPSGSVSLSIYNTEASPPSPPAPSAHDDIDPTASDASQLPVNTSATVDGLSHDLESSTSSSASHSNASPRIALLLKSSSVAPSPSGSVSSNTKASPPSPPAPSAHDDIDLTASDVSQSPVNTSAAVDGLNHDPESWRKPIFGFRKCASDRAINYSTSLDRPSRSPPCSPSRLSRSILEEAETPARSFSASPEQKHRPTSHLRPLRLVSGGDGDPRSNLLRQSLFPSSRSAISISSISSPQRPRISQASPSITPVSSASVSSSESNSYSLSSMHTSPIPHHHHNISNKSLHHTLPRSRTGSFCDAYQPASAPLPSLRRWRSKGSQMYGRSGRYPNLATLLSDAVVCEGSPRLSETTPTGAPGRALAPSLSPQQPRSAPLTRPHTTAAHAIATPKPTLLFAIASDDVREVRRVLEAGDAQPNDQVGPQSALEFTLTNDKLVNKLEIVKALLAFGADTSVLRRTAPPPPPSSSRMDGTRPLSQSPSSDVSASSLQEALPTAIAQDMDPATRYYIGRAEEAQTRQAASLIHRSTFRPLGRICYDLIGQDRALEQLFRVLSVQSQRFSVAPIVVVLCGPNGHGKSLLAHRFGSLLDVPTHTVNMTTLRSTCDLWRSFSMSPCQAISDRTLAQFLTENNSKRCVVVLDEIDKTEDIKTLSALLMPWEFGRCSVEAGSPYVDTSNVIWLCTSNVGQDMVFSHHSSRETPDSPMSREEYVELMAMLRPVASEVLGTPLMSRVTTVLPFVPFTWEEKMAIATEALYSLAGDMAHSMSREEVEDKIRTALKSYQLGEGARSLYRAISSQLING